MSSTQESRLQQTIPLTFIFQGLVYASLWMPIWVVYMNTGRGLSLTQVFLIAGIGWVVQAAAELPSGAISDTYGRKATLVVGAAVLAGGLALFAILPGFVGQLVAYIIWAIGNALISGSDDAIIFDSAAALDREDEFEKLASRSMQITLTAQAIGSISGGALAALDLRAPILVTVGLTLGALAVATRISEPPSTAMGKDGSVPAVGGTLIAAGRLVVSRPRLLMLLAYTGLISACAFFVPFVLFQPQMESFLVPIGWLGLMFMGLRLAALAGSRYGPKIVASTGGATVWLGVAPVLLATALVSVAATPNLWLGYAAMLAVAFVNAIMRPTTMALLNRALSRNIRATILSAESLVMTLFIAVVHPIVGIIADRSSLAWSFIFLAAVAVVPLVLSFPIRPFVAGQADIEKGAEPVPAQSNGFERQPEDTSTEKTAVQSDVEPG